MYVLQLILSIVVGAVAYDQLNDAIGDSAELEVLATGFDRSVFSDLINNYPEIVNNIGAKMIILMVLYWLVSVLLQGGLIASITKQQYLISNIFNNGIKYYLKNLLVVFISLLFLILLLALIWLPFFRIVGNPLVTFDTEKPFIFWILALATISSLLILSLWIGSVITRKYISKDHSIKSSIRLGIIEVKNNFISLFGYGLLILSLHIILTYIYAVSVSDWGAESIVIVIMLLIIQQLFAIARWILRTAGYIVLIRS